MITRVVANTAEVLILAEKARARLVVENHWGVSSDWRNLAAIMRAANSPALGVCLDWGNFPSPAEILQAFRACFPGPDRFTPNAFLSPLREKSCCCPTANWSAC